MRRVQEAALPLFEKRGFDAVTIEEIAVAAEVSPPTVYRGFGTKEQLVLWDEYDPMLLQAIEAKLPARSLRKAVLAGLADSLGSVYANDRDRILRRAKLMLAHPSLRAASTVGQGQLREALSAMFVKQKACATALEADVSAGAIVAALESAVIHWVRKNGRRPLGELLTAAFDCLDSL